MKKYICMGDFIKSINDGEEHYVSALDLQRLYKVPFDECFFSDLDQITYRRLSIDGINLSKLRILRPDYYGRYKKEAKK